MRSKLSVSMAEERANRLEIQLEKMTKKYERAKKDLMDRMQRDQQRGRGEGGGREGNSVAEKLLVKNKQTRKVELRQSSRVQSNSASSSKFTGNSFDDLPPFAAALAANAEREEMERRRKLGLIED